MREGPAKLSAVGVFIGVVPAFTTEAPHRYMLVSFDRRGNWKSGSHYATDAEARKARSELFAWHRKLAKQRKKRRP